MFCNECGAQIPSSAKYCDSCGTAVGESQGHPVDPPSRSVPDNKQSLVARFTGGVYGLPQTFWLFAVVVWVVYMFVETYLVLYSGMQSHTPATVVALVFIAYLFFVIPAVWNAAARHQGFKLWALLAKVVCIIWIIQLCSVVARLVTAGLT